ncbi:unnamed protein product [Amoebophrya sp. A120]|nr:unnamed protein product [Amoebophrya sp. A120]|eukprot:GSA120T00021551001.1
MVPTTVKVQYPRLYRGKKYYPGPMEKTSFVTHRERLRVRPLANQRYLLCSFSYHVYFVSHLFSRTTLSVRFNTKRSNFYRESYSLFPPPIHEDDEDVEFDPFLLKVHEDRDLPPSGSLFANMTSNPKTAANNLSSSDNMTSNTTSLEMVLEAWSACEPDSGWKVDAAYLGCGYSYLETQLGEGFLTLEQFLQEMTPPVDSLQDDSTSSSEDGIIEDGAPNELSTAKAGAPLAEGIEVEVVPSQKINPDEAVGEVVLDPSRIELLEEVNAIPEPSDVVPKNCDPTPDKDVGGADLPPASAIRTQRQPPNEQIGGSSSSTAANPPTNHAVEEAAQGSRSSTAATATSSASPEFRKIPFFLFWRGIGTVLLKSGHWAHRRGAKLPTSQSLFLELEILRERILHKHGPDKVSHSSLRLELEHAVGIASGNTKPFWLDCQQCVTDSFPQDQQTISEEQLTILTLAWLNEAAIYSRRLQHVDYEFSEEEAGEATQYLDPREFERRQPLTVLPNQHKIDIRPDYVGEPGRLFSGTNKRNFANATSGSSGEEAGNYADQIPNENPGNTSTTLFSGIMRAVEQPPGGGAWRGSSGGGNATSNATGIKNRSSNTTKLGVDLYDQETASTATGSASSGEPDFTETTPIQYDEYGNAIVPKKPPKIYRELPRDGTDITGGIWECNVTNGIPVFVHVYDVSQEDSIKRLNRFTAHKKSPIKLGGIFHAGVEVNGLEWSYGATFSDTACGIACNEPKQHSQHRYRQTIFVGLCKLTNENIAELLGNAVEKWPGDDYDLLRRNCCHFADEFCIQLGVGPLPAWIHRFARIASTLDSMYTSLSNLGKKCYGGNGTEEDDEGGGDQQINSTAQLDQIYANFDYNNVQTQNFNNVSSTPLNRTAGGPPAGHTAATISGDQHPRTSGGSAAMPPGAVYTTRNGAAAVYSHQMY